MLFEDYIARPRTLPDVASVFVDSCSLEAMTTPLPDAVKTNSRRHSRQDAILGDVIFPMGRNGFVIPIPEMVAIESCAMTRGGQSASDIFGSVKKIYELRNREFMDKLCVYDGHAFIVPAAPDDKSLSARIANQFHDIVSDPLLVREEKLTAIMDLQDVIGRGNNFGEDAAIELFWRTSSKQPIFYITEDHAARERAQELKPPSGVPIHAFGISAFYQALQARPQLLTEAGIRADLTATRFREEVEQACPNLNLLGKWRMEDSLRLAELVQNISPLAVATKPIVPEGAPSRPERIKFGEPSVRWFAPPQPREKSALG